LRYCPIVDRVTDENISVLPLCLFSTLQVFANGEEINTNPLEDSGLLNNLARYKTNWPNRVIDIEILKKNF